VKTFTWITRGPARLPAAPMRRTAATSIKQSRPMGKMAFVAATMIAMAMMFANAAGVYAACPAPTCTTGGDDTLLAGTFGCTVVITDSTGVVTAIVSQLNFDGAGNMTSAIQTTNKNAATGSTFIAWTSQGAGTYCLNKNKQTGYIFPATGCPQAFVIDTMQTEVRTLDSTQNLASVGVCEITE